LQKEGDVFAISQFGILKISDWCPYL